MKFISTKFVLPIFFIGLFGLIAGGIGTLLIGYSNELFIGAFIGSIVGYFIVRKHL